MHGGGVTTVTVTEPRPVDVGALERWLGGLLWDDEPPPPARLPGSRHRHTPPSPQSPLPPLPPSPPPPLGIAPR